MNRIIVKFEPARESQLIAKICKLPRISLVRPPSKSRRTVFNVGDVSINPTQLLRLAERISKFDGVEYAEPDEVDHIRSPMNLREGDLVITGDGYYGIVLDTLRYLVAVSNGLTEVMSKENFELCEALPLKVDHLRGAIPPRAGEEGSRANFCELVRRKS